MTRTKRTQLDRQTEMTQTDGRAIGGRTQTAMTKANWPQLLLTNPVMKDPDGPIDNDEDWRWADPMTMTGQTGSPVDWPIDPVVVNGWRAQWRTTQQTVIIDDQWPGQPVTQPVDPVTQPGQPSVNDDQTLTGPIIIEPNDGQLMTSQTDSQLMTDRPIIDDQWQLIEDNWTQLLLTQLSPVDEGRTQLTSPDGSWRPDGPQLLTQLAQTQWASDPDGRYCYCGRNDGQLWPRPIGSEPNEPSGDN